MGFLTGRATFLRFTLGGASPRAFDAEQLDQLAAHAAGGPAPASADGVSVGWAAGGHVLDTEFTPEKNVVGDCLFFDLRVDRDAIPGDLLKAYYETELKALTQDNPSGRPSAKQKREAKGAARDRIETEARDGRYRKRKCTAAVWDRHTGEVWFAGTAAPAVDAFTGLFEKTFGLSLSAAAAGRRAGILADGAGLTRPLDDAKPAPLVPGVTPEDYAWVADAASKDWLGNEFLAWLWYHTDTQGDTLTLADGSEAVFMPTGPLVLECPRGQTGSETIRHEGPTRLPEAKRAAQAGKLPRRMGLTLVRHNCQYELSLPAELMAPAGAKLPPPDPDENLDAAGVRFHRIDRLRDLAETLDLLYLVFLTTRLGADWPAELARVQQWLAAPGRGAD